MSTVTTHVLDAATGRPAAGVPVRLDRHDGSPVASAVTDDDGRVRGLGPQNLEAGVYRLVLDTGAYFTRAGVDHFYPEVTITFLVADATAHYHVPLLLSPFAYSTYRGS